ncbi:MAG TPA: DUF4335 domain-containing protein [Coleofasciculaceae cyanobacterium]|jgi:hypothetical protein
MSSSIHRFTPPTCTLEIRGKKSLLSGWKKQNLAKNWKFELRFDDPREMTSNQVTLQGDRQDLELLQVAIARYVQKYLQASFQPIDSNVNLNRELIQNNQPYLKPQGLVNHELFFGSLIHDGKAEQIKLSTVQLFDLVTALEAYQTEIATLPEKQVSATKKLIPVWGGIAAVAIAALGITTILLRSQSISNKASSPESESQPPAEIPELNEVIPPQAPETVKSISKPQLTQPLTSAKRLPPPPAVDTPKPKPNIPDPADYPLSDVVRQSGLNNSIQKEIAAQPTESTIVVPNTTKEKQEANSTTTEKIAGLAKSDVLKDSRSQPSQIQEVIVYFQQKWQPPEDLKQSLEYRLLLNADGSIKRVVALGKASQLYLKQSNIPVNGESFVSPLDESQSATVRLLLNPDGRVQAFTE